MHFKADLLDWVVFIMWSNKVQGKDLMVSFDRATSRNHTRKNHTYQVSIFLRHLAHCDFEPSFSQMFEL